VDLNQSGESLVGLAVGTVVEVTVEMAVGARG